MRRWRWTSVVTLGGVVDAYNNPNGRPLNKQIEASMRRHDGGGGDTAFPAPHAGAMGGDVETIRLARDLRESEGCGPAKVNVHRDNL